MCYHGDGQHDARALRFTSMRSTTRTYISLCVWFPHDKPQQCVLFRRETPRAHNLEIKWAFQKGQFNIRFGTNWQHDLGSPREPPFNRSRTIKFTCPDISLHIGVQQLSIHIESCMFKTNASISTGAPATRNAGASTKRIHI